MLCISFSCLYLMLLTSISLHLLYNVFGTHIICTPYISNTQHFILVHHSLLHCPSSGWFVWRFQYYSYSHRSIQPTRFDFDDFGCVARITRS